MKKYTQPELTISQFDVEDIITTSGVLSIGFDAAKAAYGAITTTEGVEATTENAVVYFNWADAE